MLRSLHHVRRRVATFARATSGVVSVEAALIAPFLLGLFAAAFVWYDAFRTNNEMIKGTYTVADMISRQQTSLPEEALDGLAFAFDFMVRSNAPTRLRLTSIVCMEDCDNEKKRRLEMCWSWGQAGFVPHDATTVKNLFPKVPLMTLGDTVIVTEGRVDYEPILDRWLDTMVLENTIVTRPRFAPEIGFEDQECF
jgi:Flp pilus assembly protein TadG